MPDEEHTLEFDHLQGSGEKILVVDDEPEFLELMVDFLENYGYQVLPVGSGDQALKILRGTLGIRAVLTDIKMPGMDGPELSRRIQEEKPPVPVIGISGKINVDEYREEYADRFRTIIQKPFLYKEVLVAVKKAVTDHRK